MGDKVIRFSLQLPRFNLAVTEVLVALAALFVMRLGVFLVLFTMFRSVNLSLQVMMVLPMAFTLMPGW